MSNIIPTLMVVEDEPLLLDAIAKKVRLNNMNVLPYLNGQDGLDYLKTAQELPDAIWLDYYLKDMNGLTFMQSLKQNSKWEKIPVVIVSNSASPDKVNNMLQLGAKRYLLKAEHRLDEIIETIKEFIREESPLQPV